MLGGRVTLFNNLSFPNSQMYRLLVLKVVFHFTNSPRLFSPPLHLFYCCYKGWIDFLAITPPPPTIKYVRKVDLFRHDFTAKRLKCFKGTIIKQQFLYTDLFLDLDWQNLLCDGEMTFRAFPPLMVWHFFIKVLQLSFSLKCLVFFF